MRRRGTFCAVSSANRQRRQQNRIARTVAVEEARRRSRRQRITVAGIGLLLAVVVAIVLVARATGNSGRSASSSTTTLASTSSVSTTSGPPTTVAGSVAGKPCVAMSGALPAGTPSVPVKVGRPPTSLVRQDLKVGTGAVVKPNATVTVNYVGVSCSTGKIFDSSFARHQPFTTPLAKVVPGWTHGIPGMRVGGERLLGIPPALAYGSSSPAVGIAPDETLWFVVQVLKTL
jgi:peptidylprolyl isomerase